MKIFNQPFDMNAFLSSKIDAAAAMTYNELAQVLESKNPKTGKLYTLKDLNVFKLQNEGTGDARGRAVRDADWISSRTATSRCGSSRRPIAGWIYCRDHVRSARTSSSRTAPRSPPGTSSGR